MCSSDLPDAFLRSAKAANFPTPHAKHSRTAQIQAVRDAGKQWLIEHEGDIVWGEWSVRRFCQYVSGCEDYTSYCTEMARPTKWADTAFIHAIACAFEVDVAIFQVSMDCVLLGISLHNGEPRAMIPLALKNNSHWWGVLPSHEDEPPVVDKGDPWFDGMLSATWCRPCR